MTLFRHIAFTVLLTTLFRAELFMLFLFRRNLGVTLTEHISFVSPLFAVGDGVLIRDTEKRPLIVGVCTLGSVGFSTSFVGVEFSLPGEG